MTASSTDYLTCCSHMNAPNHIGLQLGWHGGGAGKAWALWHMGLTLVARMSCCIARQVWLQTYAFPALQDRRRGYCPNSSPWFAAVSTGPERPNCPEHFEQCARCCMPAAVSNSSKASYFLGSCIHFPFSPRLSCGKIPFSPQVAERSSESYSPKYKAQVRCTSNESPPLLYDEICNTHLTRSVGIAVPERTSNTQFVDTLCVLK